jgi:hypothetical protein
VPDRNETRLRTRLGWVTGIAVLAAVSVSVLGLAAAHRSEEEATVANAAPAAPRPVPVRVTPQGTEASPVTWRIRPTGDRAVDDVLRAYQRYLGTAVRLAEDPDPEDPALGQVATGARLAEMERFLITAGDRGAASRGPVTASATDVRTGPTAVTLHGCTDYTRQRTVTSAGAKVVGAKVAATVLLRREDGTWRVASSTRAAVSRCR